MHSGRILKGIGPGHAKRRLRSLDTKNSLSKANIMRWNHLPHEALSLEIDARIVRREPLEADAEVTREHLKERLRLLEPRDHDSYVNRVAADLKRELRICRDVYREHLQSMNNKSITTKARVALDFAVAPMASRRLREEVVTYVSEVGVSEVMFGTLFFRLANRLLAHPNFVPEWMTFESVTLSLIPDTCFSRTERGDIARG